MMRSIQVFINTFVKIGISVLFDKTCCIQFSTAKVIDNTSRFSCIQYSAAKVIDNTPRLKGKFEDASLANYFYFSHLWGTYYALLSEC